MCVYQRWCLASQPCAVYLYITILYAHTHTRTHQVCTAQEDVSATQAATEQAQHAHAALAAAAAADTAAHEQAAAALIGRLGVAEAELLRRETLHQKCIQDLCLLTVDQSQKAAAETAEACVVQARQEEEHGALVLRCRDVSAVAQRRRSVFVRLLHRGVCSLSLSFSLLPLSPFLSLSLSLSLSVCVCNKVVHVSANACASVRVRECSVSRMCVCVCVLRMGQA